MAPAADRPVPRGEGTEGGEETEKAFAFSDADTRWKKEHVELRLKPSAEKYHADLVRGILNPI